MSVDLRALSSSTLVPRASNTQPPTKKLRPDESNIKNLSMEIKNQLYTMRRAMVTKPGVDISKVEMEVRIGMIILSEEHRRWQCRRKTKACIVDNIYQARLRFEAGIDPIFARKLKAKLATKEVTSEIKPMQKLRSDNSNNRWEVDYQGNTSMSENKTKHEQKDVALLAHDYDLRFSMATESPHAQGVNINFDNWQTERTKRRISYTHSKYPDWRMDYTEVDIIQNSAYNKSPNSGKSREIEFELELHEGIKMQWLNETNEQNIIALTNRIGDQFVALIDLLIPFESEQHVETSLVQVNCPEIDQELFATNGNIQKNKKGFEFLGSMPVNLTRQNLINVNNTEYFLAEKTDGVRYLLYVIQDKTASGRNRNIAVLIDRSKRAYKFRGSYEVGACMALGSILDGELVYSLGLRQNVFLIFDVLAWNGVSYMEQNFSVRNNFIQSDIMSPYAKAYDKLYPNGVAASGLELNPLPMIRKVFLKKNELSILLSRLSTVDGDRVYIESLKRHHRSDGIIFQPDLPYVSSRNYDLLKWKWSELRTVDLQVNPLLSPNGHGYVITLFCGGEDGTQINCTKRGSENIGLGVYDTYRLLADMEGQHQQQHQQHHAQQRVGPIIEVAYDIQVGMWEYMQIRSDKSEPNFIATVMGVFMEQAESISIEELEFTLNAASSGLENDFERRLVVKKLEILDEQRRECMKKLEQKQPQETLPQQQRK